MTAPKKVVNVQVSLPDGEKIAEWDTDAHGKHYAVPASGAAGATPRTDAVCVTPIMADAMTPHKWDMLCALSRQLERELAEANQHKRDLQEHLRVAEAALKAQKKERGK